jgi:hypothetical protein
MVILSMRSHNMRQFCCCEHDKGQAKISITTRLVISRYLWGYRVLSWNWPHHSRSQDRKSVGNNFKVTEKIGEKSSKLFQHCDLSAVESYTFLHMRKIYIFLHMFILINQVQTATWAQKRLKWRKILMWPSWWYKHIMALKINILLRVKVVLDHQAA